PIDIRQQFVNFFAVHFAQLSVSRGHFTHSSLYFGNVASIHVSVMRGDGATFSLHACAGDSSKPFAKLLFYHVELGQKFDGHFFAQSARTGDIKSVAASVNDRANVHTLTNIIEVATAEDGDGRLQNQLLQGLPHGIREQRILRMTDDRRKGAIIV